MSWHEVNFDGLVGPTHNFSGLSYGNLASTRNRNEVAWPQQAAIQGLEKMRLLDELGIPQAILPPQLRPDLEFLGRCGFHGSPEQRIRQAAAADPFLLACASSSAFMWTANAATVSPAPDTADGRLHFTPANLLTGLHRSIESAQTGRVLQFLFSRMAAEVHSALPPAVSLSDEGAANQMRMAPRHGRPGLEILVYGRDAWDSSEQTPRRFPARQTLQACQAVARLHQLDPDRVLFWKQSPQAIDQGVFHNDVVAVANENVLLCHQDAFEDQPTLLHDFQQRYREQYAEEPVIIQVPRDRVPLAEAVNTYLFNSQLVTTGPGTMTLVAPAECERSDSVRAMIDDILAGENPIQQVLFPDVRQSMQNGGGPACLRLRVLLNDQQLAQLHPGVRYTRQLEDQLRGWVESHYRETLTPADLHDPELYYESYRALKVLESILDLPAGLLTLR